MIRKGIYGLPQSGRLTNDQICAHLEKECYYEDATTPGLWRHKWRPIMFSLIVDEFGVKYVGKRHLDHIASVLRKYHDITIDWEVTKYAGIYLTWN